MDGASYRGYQLSLHAETADGPWTWGADGVPLSYDAWHPNQPNSQLTNITAYLWLPNFTFNDKKNVNAAIICEKLF